MPFRINKPAFGFAHGLAAEPPARSFPRKRESIVCSRQNGLKRGTNLRCPLESTSLLLGSPTNLFLASPTVWPHRLRHGHSRGGGNPLRVHGEKKPETRNEPEMSLESVNRSGVRASRVARCADLCPGEGYTLTNKSSILLKIQYVSAGKSACY